MAILGVDDFKANLKGGGARPNLFRVELAFPNAVGGVGDLKTISFMVKGAQMPGSTISPIVVPFRGRQIKLAGDRTFEPWTITVMNDVDFAARNAFEKWMNAINQHVENTGLVSGFEADLRVVQLDKAGNDVKSYNMVGCWPSNLGPIEVSWEAENQIEEFQVTFEVQYWTSDTTS